MARPDKTDRAEDGRLMLRGLLLSSFSIDELRGLVGEHYPDVEHSIPGPGATAEHLAAETVLALDRRGLIDARLFQRLQWRRPGRRREILACAAAWHIPASAVPEPPPSDPAASGRHAERGRVGRWFSLDLNIRSLRILIVLSVVLAMAPVTVMLSRINVGPAVEDINFTRASMGKHHPEGTERPLAADLSIEASSMLIMFARPRTAEAVQDALNKKPGQFSRLDLDGDGEPDPLTVVEKDPRDGHGFEIRVKPRQGEFVVATLMFDDEWEFLGHYDGLIGGAASTFGRPIPAEAAVVPRR